MAEWTLYTDGACQPNPGAGGWSFILSSGQTKIIRRGMVPFTTNNQMEMQAVIEGLRYVILEIGQNETVKLISDSSYLINGIETWSDKWNKNNWMKKDDSPVLNSNLWKELYILKKKVKLQCVHIKGHAGNEMNEKADSLAFEAAFLAKTIYEVCK